MTKPLGIVDIGLMALTGDVALITRRVRVGAGSLLTWVADAVWRTRLASDVQARHGADGDCNRPATP